MVRRLLKARGEAGVENSELGLCLYVAATKGYTDIAELLINTGCQVNVRRTKDRTPLMQACMGGYYDLAERLMEAGAEVCAADNEGDTTLILACLNGHCEVAGMLIKHGADVNAADMTGCTSLFVASQNGHVDVCRLLLENGAEVNLSTDTDMTALMKASDGNYKDIVELLLQHKAQVNAADTEGYTALSWACLNGHSDIAKLLLQLGADGYKPGTKGPTSLALASHGGHNDVVQLLLDRGTPVDLPNHDGRTALMFASQEGQCHTAKLLLQAGAQVNLPDVGGITSICIACHCGHLDVIKMLLEHGAEWTVVGDSGWTPLLFACEGGDLDTVELVIERTEFLRKEQEVELTNPTGVSDKAQCEDQVTHEAEDADSHQPDFAAANSLLILEDFEPSTSQAGEKEFHLDTTKRMHTVSSLRVAAEVGHTDVVRLLLEKGARVDLPELDGRTALLEASSRGHYEIVESLLKFGANVNPVDLEGLTPLILASNSGYADIVKLLLASGANVDAAERQGRTALIQSAQNGELDIVEMLLEYHAGVNKVDKRNITSLTVASEQGFTDVVRLLLRKGADVAVAMDSGKTALMQASQCGHSDIVTLLLESGARLNSSDNDGVTALFIASERGHTETVRLLLAAGADVNSQARRHRDDISMTATLLEFDNEDLWKAFLETEGVVEMDPEEEAALDIGTEDLRNENVGNTKIHICWGDEKYQIPAEKMLNRITPLMQAAQNGHSEIVSLLLDAGADINISECEGQNSLLIASGQGHEEIVQLLLQKGAKVNIPAHDGRTALMRACYHGYLGIVKMLVESGAEVNITDKENRAALMWACDAGHWDVVDYLLQAGADMLQSDRQGEKPLMYIIMADTCGKFQFQVDYIALCFRNKGFSEQVRQRSDYWMSVISTVLTGTLVNGKPMHKKFHLLLESNRRQDDIETCLYAFLPGFGHVTKPVDESIPAYRSTECILSPHTVGSAMMCTVPVHVLKELHLAPERMRLLRNMLGQSPLHLLALQTDYDVKTLTEKLQYLQKCGFTFSDRDFNGRLPIHIACIRLNVDYVSSASQLDDSLKDHLLVEDNLKCTPRQYMVGIAEDQRVALIDNLLASHISHTTPIQSGVKALEDNNGGHFLGICDLFTTAMNATRLSTTAKRLSGVVFDEDQIQRLFQDKEIGVVNLNNPVCQHDILAVTGFLELIGQEMGKSNPLFECVVELKGSIREFTRCGQMDEMDISMRLANFLNYFDVTIADESLPEKNHCVEILHKPDSDLYWRDQSSRFAFAAFCADFWLLFLELLKGTASRTFLQQHGIAIENVNRKHGFVGTMNVSCCSSSDDRPRPISVDIAPCVEGEEFEGFTALLGPRYYEGRVVGNMGLELSSFKKDWAVLEFCPKEVLGGYTLVKLLLSLTKTFQTSSGTVYSCEYIMPSYMAKTTLLWMLDPMEKFGDTYTGADLDSIANKEAVSQYLADVLDLCEALLRETEREEEKEEEKGGEKHDEQEEEEENNVDVEEEEEEKEEICFGQDGLQNLKQVYSKCSGAVRYLHWNERIRPYTLQTTWNAFHGNPQNGLRLDRLKHSARNAMSTPLPCNDGDCSSLPKPHRLDQDHGSSYPAISLDISRRSRLWALRILRLLPLLLTHEAGLRNYFLPEQKIGTRDRKLACELCHTLAALLQ